MRGRECLRYTSVPYNTARFPCSFRPCTVRRILHRESDPCFPGSSSSAQHVASGQLLREIAAHFGSLHPQRSAVRGKRGSGRSHEIASGEIWLFLDDDVALEAGFIEELLRAYGPGSSVLLESSKLSQRRNMPTNGESPSSGVTSTLIASRCIGTRRDSNSPPVKLQQIAVGLMASAPLLSKPAVAVPFYTGALPG